MGIRLIEEVLDHAPVELSTPQRLLLVVLAQNANDQTRTGWPGMATLKRRMGLKERQVRRLLADLAQLGYEVRVPSGVDKHGMPVFASKGRRTVYRLPIFRQRRTPTTALKEDVDDPLSEPKAVIHGTQRRSSTVAKAAIPVPPSLQEPSVEPSDQRAREEEPSQEELAVVITALQREARRQGRAKSTIDAITEHWAAKVIKQILDDPNGSSRNGSSRDVRHRVPYLVGAIRGDRDPARFLPKPNPPSPREVLGFDPRPRKNQTARNEP